jgi:hypothetical protein
LDDEKIAAVGGIRDALPAAWITISSSFLLSRINLAPSTIFRQKILTGEMNFLFPIKYFLLDFKTAVFSQLQPPSFNPSLAP